jgi:hypothetical protein
MTTTRELSTKLSGAKIRNFPMLQPDLDTQKWVKNQLKEFLVLNEPLPIQDTSSSHLCRLQQWNPMQLLTSLKEK